MWTRIDRSKKRTTRTEHVYRTHKRPNNLMLRFLKSDIKDNSKIKHAHIKIWIEQLKISIGHFENMLPLK